MRVPTTRGPEATPPVDGGVLPSTLGRLRALGRADVAFGGPVADDGRALDITWLHGAHTRSLLHLRVRARRGLGGQALALTRPVSVSSYPRARGITHDYDEQVRAEQLETMTALPVIVDRTPRLVLYLAHRAEVALGEAWHENLLPVVRRIERDLAVHDEVERRVSRLRRSLASSAAPSSSGVLSRADLGDIADELADLIPLVEDDVVRVRLEDVRRRVVRGRDGTGATGPARSVGEVALTPREVDVLAQVALGHSNRAAAVELGIEESTVKGHLKSAARRLGATNRVHAVRLAREAGLLA